MTDRLDHIIHPPPREEDIRDAREEGREAYEEVLENATERRRRINEDVNEHGDFSINHDTDELRTQFRLRYTAGLVVPHYTATWELDTDVERERLPNWAWNAMKLNLEAEPEGLYIHPTELTAVIERAEEENLGVEGLERIYQHKKTNERLVHEVQTGVVNILQSGEYTEKVYVPEWTAQPSEGYTELSEDPGEADMTLTCPVRHEKREVGKISYEVEGLLSHEAVGEVKVITV
jgi:hypothetical protein